MFDDPSAHIQLELGKLPSEDVRRGSSYSFVKCPFHHEKTPSLRIFHQAGNIRSGKWKCYGCAEYGRWNRLAEALGLESYLTAEDQQLEDVPKFNPDGLDRILLSEVNEQEDLKEEDLSYYSLKDKTAITKAGFINNEWRGYTLDFLRKTVKACIAEKYFSEYNKYRYYLFLPVYINGEQKGYIKAQVHKPKDKKFPSYINASGAWSLTHGLFLFDQSIELMRQQGKSSVVLVEGPRDALRLLKYGIPCMAILGTHSWSDKKSGLLEAAGVDRIVTCFDGDDAGKIATNLIVYGTTVNKAVAPNFTPLENLFNVKAVKLWNLPVPEDFSEGKFDPGNLPVSYLRKLQKLVT